MIHQIPVPSPRLSLWGLVIAAAASLLVYALLIVRPTPLLAYADQPLLDLLRIMQTFDPNLQSRLIVAFALLAGLYALGWWALRGLESHARLAAPAFLRSGWLIVLLGALVAAGLLLYLYPFDAADIFDNISHGRILGVYGANPFIAVADDFPADPFFSYVAWTSAPSAYGPFWEAWAAFLARRVGDGVVANVLAFKLLPGFFAAISVAILYVILRRRAPERVLSSVWLLAWNPLILYETFGHGHNDMMMAAWILAAVWAVDRRRYTLAVLALLLGALVKFIPILLVPAVGLIALREIQSRSARVYFMFATALASLALVVIFYLPFWEGVQILTVERRAEMLTTSLASILFELLNLVEGQAQAGTLISRIALAITAGVAIYQAFRARADRSWLSFPRAALTVLLFYLLVSVLWYQQWYMVWIVGLAVLFPPGPLWRLGLLLSFLAFLKPLVFGPLVFYWIHPQTKLEVELILSVGSMLLPWLAAGIAFWQDRAAIKPQRQPVL